MLWYFPQSTRAVRNLSALQPLLDGARDISFGLVFGQVNPRSLDPGDQRPDDFRPSDFRPGLRSDVQTKAIQEGDLVRRHDDRHLVFDGRPARQHFNGGLGWWRARLPGCRTGEDAVSLSKSRLRLHVVLPFLMISPAS